MQNAPPGIIYSKHHKKKSRQKKKLQDFPHHSVFQRRKAFQTFQNLSICKPDCQRNHKKVLCQVDMLFQQKTSRKQNHRHNKPALFFVKYYHKWYKNSDQYLQAQKPPGVDHQFCPEYLPHSKKVHYNAGHIFPKTISITRGIC